MEHIQLSRRDLYLGGLVVMFTISYSEWLGSNDSRTSIPFIESVVTQGVPVCMLSINCSHMNLIDYDIRFRMDKSTIHGISYFNLS